MRTILAVLVLGLAALASGTASAAPVYPWCAHYAGRVGGTNCGFVSFEQCMAAISGNGGVCNNNPLYVGGAAVAVRHYKKRRHYQH
jgi:hypothetical protein